MKASEFKAKRQELKMTQVQFAKMLGITARQVINIEKGVNKVTDTIKKLIENKSMMTIQVNKKRVEISNVNQCFDEDLNTEVLTATISIDNESAEFFEYVNDDELDRSSDAARYHNAADELKDLISEKYELDCKFEIDDVLNEIYDAMSHFVECTLDEYRVNEIIERNGFKLLGLDAYNNNMWHVASILSDNTTMTAGHCLTLRQVLEQYS